MQWVLDNKRQEYRDLSDALFQATEEIIKERPNIAAGVSPALLEAVWKGQRSVRDRIFVAREIQREGLDEDWDLICKLALWEPIEQKLVVKGTPRSYSINQIVELRKDLHEKLHALIRRDLRIDQSRRLLW